MRTEKTLGKVCVGTGFVVLDVIRSGRESEVVERRFAGGSCGNVLTILAYLGWKSVPVARIGADYAGQELLADLGKWNVDTRFLRLEEGRGTPIVLEEIFEDAKGRPRHRFSMACPQCGAPFPRYRPVLVSDADSLAAALPPHRAFYFDRVAPGNLELARRSRNAGALVVFEPSGIKDPDLFSQCLQVAHIVKYSHERLAGIDEQVASVETPVEVETRGAEGLRVRVRHGTKRGSWKTLGAISAPSLKDAAGSGDWSTAGLMHALCADDARTADAVVADADFVVQGLRAGQALAALNCAYAGARGLMYAVKRESALEDAQLLLGGRTATTHAARRQTNPAPSSPPACVACAAAL